MAHGARTLCLLWLAASLMALTACAPRLPAVSAAAPVITLGDLPSLSVRLGDMPAADILVTDLTPTDAQLATLLALPAGASAIAPMGRLGGTYRVFAYTTPEPTDLNGTVRATVEVDLFASPAGAALWFGGRADALAATAGALLPAPAPGQRHALYTRVYRVGDVAATDTTLLFIEGAVAVTITTEFVGLGVSTADAAYYADLIDGRIIGTGN